MKKRIRSKHSKLETVIKVSVDSAFNEGFASILADISYRISQMWDTAAATKGYAHKVTTEMLNISTPILDGFTFTDNSPVAGSVAWADCHVVYKGVNYVIANGNTANKYIWWDFSAAPNTVFQSSATKPVLTDDDILVCINDGGVHQMVVGQGRMSHGGAFLDGTVGSSEIGTGAVTTAKIASAAITSTLMGAGAVTSTAIASGAVTSGALATGAVGSGALATGAVTAGKIAAGGISAATQFATGVVDSTALGASAVTSAKIAADAVTTTAIAAGAVGNTEIAASAVGTTQLIDSSVTATKIGAGAVATDKLNTALHMIF